MAFTVFLAYVVAVWIPGPMPEKSAVYDQLLNSLDEQLGFCQIPC